VYKIQRFLVLNILYTCIFTTVLRRFESYILISTYINLKLLVRKICVSYKGIDEDKTIRGFYAI
jgi:hypothetical protein